MFFLIFSSSFCLTTSDDELLRCKLHAERLCNTITLMLAQCNLTISQMPSNELPGAVQVLQALVLVGAEISDNTDLVNEVLVHTCNVHVQTGNTPYCSTPRYPVPITKHLHFIRALIASSSVVHINLVI
jgi:hypothetical protein